MIFSTRFFIFIEFIVLHREFWAECKNRVSEVLKTRAHNNVVLPINSSAQKCLDAFMSMVEVSERVRAQIIDVATTAALIDKSDTILERHIIEASELRLFDRQSRVSALNDSSIPKYNKDVGHKFEPWINNFNVP